MTTTLACAELGGQCPEVFTTEDVDELMDHVSLHAASVHPELELTPEVVQQAKTEMRSS